MVIDGHTHICPPAIRSNRETFFAGEDNFRTLYANPKARLVGATDLMAYLNEEGISAACAFGFSWNSPDRTRLCNEYILDAAARFPGRVLAFAGVNPLLGKAAVREVERCLAQGARGVGEIATYGEGLGPQVRAALGPLAELCREAEAPLVLHTNEPVGHEYPGKSRMELSQIYDLVKTHPGTTWILAHWGGGLFVYHLLKKEAGEVLRNVCYDTAAGPFLYRPDVYRLLIDIAGPQRLVFGSDYPLLGLPRYRADAEAAGLAPPQTEAIFGGNLARILGLEENP